MSEVISQEMRKARKKHRCDYCGETIEPGEIYQYSALKYDGIFYDWHSHERCKEIASQIWDYVDPYDGMTEEDFCEACQDICRTFVCPYHCPDFDKECGECSKDETFCTQRMADFFQTHDLVRDRESGKLYTWKCEEKKQKEGEADGALSAAAVPQAQ